MAKFNVLCIPDLHLPAMRPGFIEFCERVADEYRCDKIVFMGDVVDWHAISYHEKNPDLPSPADELKRVKKMLARIVKVFPKADWLIGNHDDLTHRQARSAGLPSAVIKSHNEIFDVPWKVHPRFSTLKIDDIDLNHGEVGKQGQDAAIKQAAENFNSRAIAHIHSEMGVKFGANQSKRYWGMSCGWGGDQPKLQFDYGRKFPRKGILGCGVIKKGEPIPVAMPLKNKW